MPGEIVASSAKLTTSRRFPRGGLRATRRARVLFAAAAYIDDMINTTNLNRPNLAIEIALDDFAAPHAETQNMQTRGLDAMRPPKDIRPILLVCPAPPLWLSEPASCKRTSWTELMGIGVVAAPPIRSHRCDHVTGRAARVEPLENHRRIRGSVFNWLQVGLEPPRTGTIRRVLRCPASRDAR